ncbi:hypothetical protein [Actinomadura rugatobispora]|uniref:DUF4352 domain-containing protein n=1 Tax=Actinomadura rugatobispora TaxID=1994 RepID=A0ABW1A4Q2_9ACTN|nr:hypothetical protein GCM10010200_061840 [Actinomadura rugatobispora]
MDIRHHTAAIAAVTALLAGCSSLPGGGEPAERSDGAAREGTDVPAGRPGVDTTGRPVVGATFDTPIANGAKIDIAVMGLQVRGKLATLTVRLTPHVPADHSDQGPSPYALNGRHAIGASLLDPVNLKRYVVVRDSSGKALQTDDIFTDIRNNQPGLLTYTFAAPPENVKALDVQYGSWPLFRNVPVGR